MSYTKTLADKLESAIDEGGDIECSADTAALIYSAVEKLRSLDKIELWNQNPIFMGTGMNNRPMNIMKPGINLWDSDVGTIDATDYIPKGCASLLLVDSTGYIVTHTMRELS